MNVQTVNVSILCEGKVIAKETTDLVDMGAVITRMVTEAEVWDEVNVIWSDADDSVD